MPAAVRFEVGRRDTGAVVFDGIVPYLGDTSLLELVGRFETRHGYDPADGYSGLSSVPDPWEHYVDVGPGARRWLLGCDCGEDGCWPLEASVVVAEDVVTWSDFAQPFRPLWTYDGFGPFVFPRPDYEAAVRDLVARWGRSST